MRVSRSLVLQAIGMGLFVCTLCATAPDYAHAQVVSGTVIVDTTPSTAAPYSSDSATLTSSAGSVEVKADAFKATGQRGFVRLKVTRRSTLLNGYVRIAGFLQCGNSQRPVVFERVRPGITTAWQTEVTCSNTESPVVFVADLSLWPN
jgi:hypothetical protein